MKIRNGFVSNSSSSSFCIFGAVVDEKGYEQIEKEVSDAGLYYNWGPEFSEGVYVGREWSKIGDDETGQQFKDSVEEDLERIFGKPLKCSTHEQGWYDG